MNLANKIKLILAIKILNDKHGIKANLITINTHAYNGKEDPENPLNNSGINDIITFWTHEDQVAGGLAGEDHHEPKNNSPRNQVFPLKERAEVSGMYSDHFLENVDPKSIENSKADKLKPRKTNK